MPAARQLAEPRPWPESVDAEPWLGTLGRAARALVREVAMASVDAWLRLLLLAALPWLAPSCGVAANPGATATAPSRLVEFTRTGGFAGVDDHLIVYTDRQAALRQKSGQSQFEVDRETYDRLRLQLEQAGFADLEEDYRAKPGAADLFTYAVTYGGRTVRAQDTAVPAPLQPVIGTLHEIVQAHSNRE